MANSIIQNAATWVSGSSVFEVSNENTGASLWAALGVIRVEIPSEADITKEPLSNVQYKDDGTYTNLLESDLQSIKILKPGRMRISGLCGDLSTLESIIASQKDPTLKVTVYTKSVISENLIITDVDFDQVPDRLSATQVTISLEQGVPPASTQYNPAQPGDESQYGFKVQSPIVATTTVSGLFNKVASKVTNVVKPIAGALLGSKGESFILDTSKMG